MTNNELKPVPEPTLRRLPQYLHYLKGMHEEDKKQISTTVIAGALKLDPTQVRKDLAYTGIIGKPKIGYTVDVLIKSIENFLNWQNTNDAFLIGAGNLGLAMIGYDQFKKYGLNIVALFDNDENKVGTEIKGVPVLPVSKLTDLVRRMHINIGILTVPASAAQEIADKLVEGGIKAIWNFAPVTLNIPQEVIIENAQFATSFAVLSHKLAEKLNEGFDA